MDFSDIFRIVNLAVGVFTVLGGVAQFFGGILSKDIVLGTYLILFGASTAVLEFQIPPQISRYASFMFSFIGRGLFYFFVGSIILGEKWWMYIPGGLIMFIGLAYVVLEYIPSIEPPANMREADAGWGAEQV